MKLYGARVSRRDTGGPAVKLYMARVSQFVYISNYCLLLLLFYILLFHFLYIIYIYYYIIICKSKACDTRGLYSFDGLAPVSHAIS